MGYFKTEKSAQALMDEWNKTHKHPWDLAFISTAKVYK
jgi:hypothetical protein